MPPNPLVRLGSLKSIVTTVCAIAFTININSFNENTSIKADVDGSAEWQLVTRLPHSFQNLLLPLYKGHTPRHVAWAHVALSSFSLSLSCTSTCTTSRSRPLVSRSRPLALSPRLPRIDCHLASLPTISPSLSLEPQLLNICFLKEAKPNKEFLRFVKRYFKFFRIFVEIFQHF